MKIKISDFTNNYVVSNDGRDIDFAFKDGELHSIIKKNNSDNANFETGFDGETYKTGLLCLSKEEILFIINLASDFEGSEIINKNLKNKSIEDEIAKSEQYLSEITAINNEIKSSIYLARSMLNKYGKK